MTGEEVTLSKRVKDFCYKDSRHLSSTFRGTDKWKGKRRGKVERRDCHISQVPSVFLWTRYLLGKNGVDKYYKIANSYKGMT